MAKYKKKPVVIDAIQFTGLDNGDLSPKTVDFFGDADAYIVNAGEDNTVVIAGLDGNMKARVGDYLIKDADGEFYPIKEDVFRQYYEPAE